MKMDLLSEASSATRVLSARHISAEKTLPDGNKAVNTTVLMCYSHSIQPHFSTYVEALQPYIWIIWSCGLVVLIATYILFAFTMKSAKNHWKSCIVNVAVVLSVYPLVSTCSFLVLVVPRSRMLAEALAQQVVMVAMYHLYKMFITECGGEDKLVSFAEDPRLETRVPPCCCWPCCLIPKPKLDKKSLSWVRYLILQMAVIQGIIYIIILVLWAEDLALYLAGFMYIQVFVAISILSGVWGMIMCVKTISNTGVNPRPRFLALQLVLLIVKLQCGLAKALAEMLAIPCIVNLNPTVLVHLTHYGIMMLEMLLLSIWAWRLYRTPSRLSSKISKVVIAVTEESSTVIKARNMPEKNSIKQIN